LLSFNTGHIYAVGDSGCCQLVMVTPMLLGMVIMVASVYSLFWITKAFNLEWLLNL